jgi:hypothetical protein
MASASIEDKGGGRWRIRWREKRPEGSWAQPEVTVHGSAEDAESYRLVVIRDLRERGQHDPAVQRARHAPPATVLDGMIAYIAAAEADGLRASSAATYRATVPLLAEAIHEVTRIPETAPLPVTLLNRRLFDALKPVLARRGQTVPHAYLRVLWAAWGWLADDPTGWPQTPPRPSSLRGYVPSAAPYGRTVAPTLEHADACLRRLRARRASEDTVLAVVILRYTGLRLRQVTGIAREDLDLSAGTLLVRHGKSRAERAEMRTVPLAAGLRAEPLFRAAVSAEAGKGPLLRCSNPRATVFSSWEDASELDGVPRNVWAPPNRINARPDHAFRAAFQAHLAAGKVAGDVVDFLVGHRGDLRGTHYGRDLDADARAAVDGLPPIKWG